MNAHRPELADVFRAHEKEFLARWRSVLSRPQLRAIRDCRTAALGGHLQKCDRCGHRVILYNSCRNRHCPKCQATARARWLEQREAELLPVPYFHVVFTLPQQTGYLVLQNARTIYNILFRAAAQCPAAFEALCEQAAKLQWVVHIQPPFGGPQRVLKYLARYTHRVAISNHRLRALEKHRVSFQWKDYAHHGQRKIMTLDAVDFLRRFLLHVLPSGLVRIRHFGFLANRFRTPNLQLCRDLLAVRQPPKPADSHNPAVTNVQDRSSCPICKLGQLITIEVIHPERTLVPDTS
jgi:hypothetical protein